MTSTSTQVHSEVASRPLPHESSAVHGIQPVTKEELDGVLRALEIPFDTNLVQWRVTEWSDDGRRGLMLPYGDPRAYTDRLNDLFTPAGWTRKYAIHTSANFQRGKDQTIVAKILVTCELTIFGLGSHSATGEEFADSENACTAAEAQAFKPKPNWNNNGNRNGVVLIAMRINKPASMVESA